MKNNLVEISKNESKTINGGGIFYDLYKIIIEEKDDFVKGFKEAYNNGIF